MRINNTLQQLRRGETVFGCAIQSYRSPEVTRVFAAAGFDYVFIDMEHGAFDFETVHEMIVASNQAGITPVVRVGELLYSLVSRLLDTGAQGIVLPRVEDPNRLAEALTWMKYPPHGVRGYGILPTPTIATFTLSFAARTFPGSSAESAASSRNSRRLISDFIG
jgi:2-keto-3-deoxy-L-rhamnonate aldolase RhmA